MVANRPVALAEMQLGLIDSSPFLPLQEAHLIEKESAELEGCTRLTVLCRFLGPGYHAVHKTHARKHISMMPTLEVKSDACIVLCASPGITSVQHKVVYLFISLSQYALH